MDETGEKSFRLIAKDQVNRDHGTVIFASVSVLLARSTWEMAGDFANTQASVRG